MHCRAHHLLIAVISILGLGQMIVACGQEGDLYLPKPEPAQQTTASTETKAAQQAKADGKAVVKAGPEATSEIEQPKPARQTPAGAEADAARQVATEDESAVKAGPAAAAGVEQPEQE